MFQILGLRLVYLQPAAAIIIHDAEVVLRFSEALVGRQPPPSHRLCPVLRQPAAAVEVRAGDVELRFNEALTLEA